jgi:hypothetical protein
MHNLGTVLIELSQFIANQTKNISLKLGACYKTGNLVSGARSVNILNTLGIKHVKHKAQYPKI